MIRLMFTLIVTSILSTTVFAKPQSPDFSLEPMTKYDDVVRAMMGTFVQLPNGHILFARFKPPQKGKPTIVLANGLPDGLDSWNGLDVALQTQGYGVLTFDFRGQNNSLAYSGAKFGSVQDRLGGDLSWQAQVEDMLQLDNFFGIKRSIRSGLSYGAGLQLAYSTNHPERVSKVIAFAPYLAPLQSQIKIITELANWFKLWFPFATEEQCLDWAGRYIAYTQDVMAEPDLLLKPWGLGVEALIAMGKGLAGLDMLKTLNQLPKNSLYLSGGTADQVEPPADLDTAFANAGDAAVARIYEVDGQHRETTYDPFTAYQIIQMAIQKTVPPKSYISYNPYLRSFRYLDGPGNPSYFSGGGNSCEALFGN